MKFPTMVYRTPGPHQRKGGTYDFLGVKTQVEFDAAIKNGWFETLPEALGEKPVVVAAPIEKEEFESLGDNEPPTRAELEKQATELGVKFTKKTTDEELNKKIDESLGS